MNYFRLGWLSWSLFCRRRQRRTVTLGIEQLEPRQLFSVGPLVAPPYDPVTGIPATSQDWVLSRYTSGLASPSVQGITRSEEITGTFTLDAEGSFDFTLGISGLLGGMPDEDEWFFGFNGSGAVTYTLHREQGVEQNQPAGGGQFVLIQTGYISFDYADNFTQVSATTTFGLSDPGSYSYTPDATHWMGFNWWSIASYVSDAYHFDLTWLPWTSVGVQQSGTHSYTLSRTTTASVTSEGANLINDSLSSDNVRGSYGATGTVNADYYETGSGTFTFGASGTDTAAPYTGLALNDVLYAESGTHSFTFHHSGLQTVESAGASLRNSIDSADPVYGSTTIRNDGYEGTTEYGYELTGGGSYTLQEELGSYAEDPPSPAYGLLIC